MKRILIICIVFFALKCANAQNNISLNGYVKLLGTFNNVNPSFISPNEIPPLVRPLFPYSSQDYQIHNRFNFRWYGKKGFSAGIGMRNRLFHGYTVRSFDENRAFYSLLGYDSYNDLIAFPTYFNLSITWWENNTSVMHTVFDRVWLQWENDNFRVRLGRQRINWGINTAFNPNDLFNQYNFFDFDYEERPGVDAVLMQYYINPKSSIEAAFTPGKDSVQQSTGAALYRINIFEYDWQVLAGYYQGDLAVGGGWAGNIKNAGFKGEITYFIPTNPNYSMSSLVLSSNVDYSFKSGVYVMLGCIYNQLGEANPGVLDQIGITNAQLTAKNLFPYQFTISLTAGYNITALLRADLSWLQTPNFANSIAVPSLTYSIAQNLDFLVLGQLFFAEKPSDQSFGFFTSSIFTRLKYSF